MPQGPLLIIQAQPGAPVGGGQVRASMIPRRTELSGGTTARVVVSGLLVLGLACTREAAQVATSGPTEVYAAPPSEDELVEDEPALIIDAPEGRLHESPREVELEVWEGEGIQNDGQKWRVVLNVLGVEHTPCAIVEYPTIPCAGEWLCSGKSSNSRLVGVESITHEAYNCIDGCEFDAELEAGTVQYACHDENVFAQARIDRTE